MVDEEFLLAISNVIDVKLAAFGRTMDTKLESLEKRMDAKIEGVKADIQDIKTLQENEILPRKKGLR